MSTRSVSSPIEPKWLQLLRLSLVVMRCQPLRRALSAVSNITHCKGMS
ncbi:exlusion protein FxsA [Vibrio cholerae]|nr:exlusion protein FxsA [Vibrio cholerae]MCD1200443.1 exlusion protein FxsA [Vibrio cholerae]MCD1209505.1 exlusion protein FxsA [Vibrio cholerae]MCD1213191.1 exlusion protein FxsA [Vibrio cholerae]MCD1227738.1 exlusion protein FxsA [Vibrio cholerae]